MILTRKVKLLPTAEQQAILLETLKQYKKSVDLPLQYGYQHKQVSGVELHKATYHPLRKQFPNLPSQLVCSARCKATEALKSIKTKTKGTFQTKQPKSGRCPAIRYDRNSCSFTPNSVKLSTIAGRIEIKIVPNPFLGEEWKSVQPTCELQYKYLRGEWYLNVFVEKPEPTPIPQTNVLGIDRGCKHVAVLSNNHFYDSKNLRRVKGKYKYLRKRLQSKGTKSANRLLKKISGKENRFVRDVNHCISKQIVALPFDTFVLERLEIKRSKDKGRRFNTILGGWSYFQLENFLTYKAVLAGKTVAHVDARYTSQKCSCCGHTEKANRQGVNFSCRKCGFNLHADLNGSRNIRNNYIAAQGTSLSSRVQSITHTFYN